MRSFLVVFALLNLAVPIAQADDSLPARNSVNVKGYPLPLALRLFMLDVDIGAFRNVTLGPTLASFLFQDQAQNLDLNAGWLGIRANWTLGNSRFSDSWFLATSISGAQVKGTSNVVVGGETVQVSATIKASVIGLFGGYQWFWGNGFNLSLGAGLYSFGIKPELVLNGTASSGASVELPVTLPKSARAALPWAELGVGWVF